MKNKITLKFIPSDFTETRYINYYDCAITRALNRAGFNYRDTGLTIKDENNIIITDNSNNSYCKLKKKVKSMYATVADSRGGNGSFYSEVRIPVKKFQHTLIF